GSEAQDMLDSCTALEEVLLALQVLDLDSAFSHWAKTEYGALSAELTSQRTAASSRLLRDRLPQDIAASQADEDIGETAPPLAIEQTTRGLARLTITAVNDLEDLDTQYPCGWDGEGVCARGCTVGGCWMQESDYVKVG
ncbi:unnamed protein product, partial [Prorocentrum cordatum]